MKGNRPSILPIARFCAKAPAMSAGCAGRAAAMSSVWHARAAGKDWRDSYNRLTDEEKEEVDSWCSPTTALPPGGKRLEYSNAAKEVEVAITEHGTPCHRYDHDCMSAGTVDFFWVSEDIRGKFVFVGDLKKTEWACPDGPRSLQLLFYAIALASIHQADYYICGVFHADKGTWEWGEPVDVDSDQAFADWQAVKAAALHTDGDFNVGTHCKGCYGRSKCPAYLVDPEHAEAGIKRYLTGELDVPSTLRLLQFVERVEETCKTARKIIKAQVDLNGGLSDGNGKVYKPIKCSGRVTLDKVALEADYPELVQKYMRPGRDFEQYRWVNEREKKQ